MRESPRARASRPILVRFDSKYAALCGSGVWKGTKNKKLVATARAEWKATADLKRRNGVGFWLKHVKGHSGQKWNDAAGSLATRGLDGERHMNRYRKNCVFCRNSRAD